MDKTVELSDPLESGTSITDFKKSGGSLVPSSSTISLVGWMRLDSRYGMGDTDFSTMKRTNSQVAKSDDAEPAPPMSQGICSAERDQESTSSVNVEGLNLISDVGLTSTVHPRGGPQSKRRVVTKSEEIQFTATPELQSEPADGVLSAETAIAVAVSDADMPDPSSTKCSPDEYLLLLTKAQLGIDLEAKQASSLISFFAEVTEEQMAAYTTEVVRAVRNNDLDLLKTLHGEGQTLDCSNRFGESLLNMACRRGFEAMVQYLMENDVNVRLCDDSGRTPLHDACWNPTPQLQICQVLIEREPSLLLVADRRGCTAFQYARMEHWDQWRTFLFENRQCLLMLNQPHILAIFAKSQNTI